MRKALKMARRCCGPPLRLLPPSSNSNSNGDSPRQSVKSSRSIKRFTSSLSTVMLGTRMVKLSLTVPLNKNGCWLRYPMLASQAFTGTASRRAADSVSLSPTFMPPEIAGCKPKMVLTRVLLPEPEGPTIACTRPGSKVQLRLENTGSGRLL